jgi:AcrR family transcriptional regulator
MNVQSEIAGKKKAILKSTLRIIRSNGFQGTPISLIAKDAGVASGTIYHYFPSKDALILELYNTIRKEMLAAMFDNVPEECDFKSRFFKGWKNLCMYFITHPENLLFIEQYNCSPYYKISSKKNIKIPANKFNEFFQYGMDNGFLKKMEYNLVASVVFGGIVATAKYHITGRFGYNENNLCKIANIIWDGIKSEQ